MEPLLNVVLPIIGLVAGFFLREVGDYFRRCREDRAVVGRILLDLMEIRKRFLALDSISDRLKLSQRDKVVIRAVFESWLPSLEDVSKKYEAAIYQLAGASPLVAFRLRSQDAFPTYLTRLRALAMQDDGALTTWAQTEDVLRQLHRPHFEELICDVAWLHGFPTWRGVRRQLKEPLTIPAELEQMLTQAAAAVQPPSR